MDDATLTYLANLARIQLDPARAAHVQRHFQAFLDYLRCLEGLPTDQVEPAIHPLPVTLRLRADEPQSPLAAEEVLANAPDVADGCFRVPRAVGGT